MPLNFKINNCKINLSGKKSMRKVKIKNKKSYVKFFLYSFLVLFISFNYLPLKAELPRNEITDVAWKTNSLIINTKEKISYVESRLKEPGRLIIDILNCSIDEEKFVTSYKSEFEEHISIGVLSDNKIRITFLGDASVNRKAYLTNNDRTLAIRIARVNEEEQGAEKETEEKIIQGKIREISLEEDNSEAKVIISGTKSIKYNYYILKDPDRFAVDLLNLFPPVADIPETKGSKFISGIRLGTAANSIEVSRVVFDLARSNLECKIDSNLLGNKLEITIKEIKEPIEEVKKSGVKVVIDPGHGGYDTGASYGGYQEKDINLVMAEKLKKALEKSGITAFLTRDDDSFLSLAERVEITNSIKPDVFISIHGNALATSKAIRGVETYYWTSKSNRLAYYVHYHILKYIKIPDHYIRRAQFYVIRHTPSPAVLAELAFLSNSDDRKLLTDSQTQDLYAKALTEAILKFLDIDQKPSDKDTKKKGK